MERQRLFYDTVRETIVRTAVAELEQPQRLQHRLFASMASPPHAAPPSDLPAGVPGTLPPLLLSSGSLPETHLKRRLLHWRGGQPGLPHHVSTQYILPAHLLVTGLYVYILRWWLLGASELCLLIVLFSYMFAAVQQETCFLNCPLFILLLTENTVRVCLSTILCIPPFTPSLPSSLIP